MGDRAFKRGDWVQWTHGPKPCIHRHCLFMKDRGDGIAYIDDDGRDYTVHIAQLRPDEAPA